MPRRVFYSFHYQQDVFRTGQVRNSGAVEGNKLASDNDWEKVKAGGDEAIKRWIDGQLTGRSCTVVLIGAETAGRPWIKHEIQKSWEKRMGLLGIHIHRLLDQNGNPSGKGQVPFVGLQLSGEPLSEIVRTYDPPGTDSKAVYGHIAANLEDWIEAAIKIRNGR